MIDALPAFSGDNPTCVKCGHDHAFTRWVRDREVCDCGKDWPERLHRQCSRCDYTWDEALQPEGMTS